MAPFSHASRLHQLPSLSALTQGNWQPLSFQAASAPQSRSWTTAEKLSYLRSQKVGRLHLIPGPDLWRGIVPEAEPRESWHAMLHLDYTASAQALHCVETYLEECMATYANTHTETSMTGKTSTQRFHTALEIIRRHVHAGAESFVIPTGYGATGAIEKIQKILGVYLSPKGQKTIEQSLGLKLKEAMAQKAVVFVGPSEHHSNDVSWQDDTLCTFVRIKAVRSGERRTEIDYEDLREQLGRFGGYLKIGSFSAASNVTGLRCDLKKLGEILHEHQALFLCDFAASGPYADINMERDGIDAIFLSLHKNLGGANIGFLVGKKHIYDMSVNPSFGGGGTVAAVTPWEYHFHASIEERESAGTPAIRQTWQAALSFQLKEWVGLDEIQKRDDELTARMIKFISEHSKLELLGNPDPRRRYPIFSFLVQHGQRKLHHNFVAVLLNDFFGIQARSGCACAGPFGHELLGIPRELSSQYVQLILNILNGFKPGWTRIGTHYTLSDAEVTYIERALSAIAWFGALFLDQYSFDPYSGDWSHQYPAAARARLDFEDALGFERGSHLLPKLDSEASLQTCFANQLEEFYALAALQIARLILQETKGREGASATLDALATATYPLIKRQIEAQGSGASEKLFLQGLIQAVCPLLAPPGKSVESCKSEVEALLRGIIFAPEQHGHRYERFDGIDAHLPFFFVAKGRLSRPLDAQAIKLNKPIYTCRQPLAK